MVNKLLTIPCRTFDLDCSGTQSIRCQSIPFRRLKYRVHLILGKVADPFHSSTASIRTPVHFVYGHATAVPCNSSGRKAPRSHGIAHRMRREFVSCAAACDQMESAHDDT